jgi:hypothetical protein
MRYPFGNLKFENTVKIRLRNEPIKVFYLPTDAQ